MGRSKCGNDRVQREGSKDKCQTWEFPSGDRFRNIQARQMCASGTGAFRQFLPYGFANLLVFFLFLCSVFFWKEQIANRLLTRCW